VRSDFQIVRSTLLWHEKCLVYVKVEDKFLILGETQMRSDLVFGAMKQVSNRFLLAKVLAKATRELHRPGARIEDTTNDVLLRCGCAYPIADENAVRSFTTVVSPRNRPHPAVVHRTGTSTDFQAGESSDAPSEPSRVLVA
jgi:hypothetical protein